MYLSKKNQASHNQFHLTVFIAQVEHEKTTEYKEQFYSFHTSIGFVILDFLAI